MRVEEQQEFGTRECPSCACEVARNENRCPICGYEFPSGMKSRATLGFIAGAILLGLFLAMLARGL